MAEYESLSGLFTDIADAIREKTGYEEPIQAEAFPRAIRGISTQNADPDYSPIISKTLEKYNDVYGTVTYIGSSVFADCYSLKNVSFPACKEIGTWAFYLDDALETADLGPCEKIGDYAFRGCSKLQVVRLNGDSVCEIGMYTLSSTPMAASSYLGGSYGSIYVPESLVSEYQSAKYWSAYSHRFVGI